MAEQLYVVCWQSITTGLTGRGQPFTKQSAESWKEYCDTLYKGEFIHWIEPALLEHEAHNG